MIDHGTRSQAMPSPVPPDLAIDALLADLGYRDPIAKQEARTALEAAGLTHARKTRIATSKTAAVGAVLATRFVLVCDRATCHTTATTPRIKLHAMQPTDCTVCHGVRAPNQTAITDAIAALDRRGWRRVVVVGGSPGTCEELAAIVGKRLELRLVPGTDRRTSRDAKADLAWADVIVVWGSTELAHRVSKLYTDGGDRRVVICPKRGIAALAATISESARL